MKIFRIVGSSMEPNFYHGEYVVVRKKRSDKLRIGHVVLINTQHLGCLVKRVEKINKHFIIVGGDSLRSVLNDHIGKVLYNQIVGTVVLRLSLRGRLHIIS